MRKIVLLFFMFMLLLPAAAFASYQYELEQEISNMRMDREEQQRLLSEYQGKVAEYIKEVEQAQNDNLSNLKTAQDDYDYNMFTFFGNRWFPTWLSVLNKYNDTGLSVGTPEGQKEAAKFSAMIDPQSGNEMSMTYGAYDSAKYVEALNGIFYARRYIEYYDNLIDYVVSHKDSGISQQQYDTNMGYYRERNNSAIVGDPFPYNKERVQVSDSREAVIYDLLRFTNEEGGGFSSEDVVGSGSGELFVGMWQGRMNVVNVYVDALNREFGLNVTQEEAQEGLGLNDRIDAEITKGDNVKHNLTLMVGGYPFDGDISVSGNKIQISFHDSDLPDEVDYVYTGEANADGSKVSGSWKLVSTNSTLAMGNWSVSRVGEASSDTGDRQPDGDAEKVPAGDGGDPAGSGASGDLKPGSDSSATNDADPGDDNLEDNSNPDTGAVKDQEKEDKSRKMK